MPSIRRESLRLSVLLILCVVGLAARVAVGSTPQLININSQIAPSLSNPVVVGTVGREVIVAGSDGSSRAVWATDGTPAGLIRLKTFSASGVFGLASQVRGVTLGGALYFAAGNAEGPGLWKTDGTPDGTVKVFGPSGANAQLGLIGLAGSLVALQVSDSAGSLQLYVSDGTTAGTRQISNFGQRSSIGQEIVSVGAKFYFSGGDSSGGGIYVSDGTAAGTRLVANPYDNPSFPGAEAVTGVQSMRHIGNRILYCASGLVWSIDIATDTIGAVVTSSGQVGFGPPKDQSGVDMLDMGSYALLIDSTFAPAALYRTDGTTAGTTQVATVVPYTSSASLQYQFLERVGDRALFLAADATYGIQLWSTDGTTANTVRLSNAGQQSVAYDTVRSLGIVNGVAYFSMADSAAQDASASIWRSDGTPAGTFKLNGFAPIAAAPPAPVLMAGDATRVYFNVFAWVGQIDVSTLYALDAGAQSVVRLQSGLNVNPNYSFYCSAGHLFFSNNDPLTGEELWFSDGTAAGTGLLANLAPDVKTSSSSPDEFVELDGQLVFAADDGLSGRELWTSDGSTAGTRLLADVNPGAAASNPNHLFVLNKDLYFFAQDASNISQFMRLPSGAAIPQALAALTPQSSEFVPGRLPDCTPDGAVALGAKVFFLAYDSARALRLWSSDGTAAGTIQVSPAPLTYACGLTVFQNRIYFSAVDADGGGELWMTDGTTAGTARVVDIVPGPSGSGPQSLQVLGGALYFSADNGAGQTKVWKSDGTAAGTTTFGNMPSDAFSDTALGSVNSKILINAGIPDPNNPGSQTNALFSADGTSAATLLATGVGQVMTSSGLAYFISAASGRLTLSVTDGTPSGTHPVKDLVGAAAVQRLVSFDGLVLFDTYDSTNNSHALWQSDGTASGTTLIASIPQFPAELGYRLAQVNSLVVGQRFFFSANDPTDGVELFALSSSAPTAVADTAAADTGGSVTISVLANDADSGGVLDSASVKVVTAPAHGSVSAGTQGTLVYTPTSGFSGTDTFSYTVADNRGRVSQPASVTVTVKAAASTGSASTNDGEKKGGGGALDLYSLLCVLGLAGMRLRCSPRSSD